MKTTLDLPNDLVKEVKLHALHGGRKLKDTVADLLRKGLSATNPVAKPALSPRVKTDAKTGLPYFPPTAKAPIAKMKTKEIYALLHQAQAEEDLERVRPSLRR